MRQKFPIKAQKNSNLQQILKYLAQTVLYRRQATPFQVNVWTHGRTPIPIAGGGTANVLSPSISVA